MSNRERSRTAKPTIRVLVSCAHRTIRFTEVKDLSEKEMSFLAPVFVSRVGEAIEAAFLTNGMGVVSLSGRVKSIYLVEGKRGGAVVGVRFDRDSEPTARTISKFVSDNRAVLSA